MKLTGKDYTIKVSGATPLGLVLISFELLFDSLHDAIDNADDIEIFTKNTSKAKAVIAELILSLDMSLDISYELMRLYLYVNKLIIDSAYGCEVKKLDESIMILRTIYDGFVAISHIESETEGKSELDVYGRTKVVSGLSYDRRGNLVDYYDEGRDYK